MRVKISEEEYKKLINVIESIAKKKNYSKEIVDYAIEYAVQYIYENDLTVDEYLNNIDLEKYLEDVKKFVEDSISQ